jgi:hypothetical protein
MEDTKIKPINQLIQRDRDIAQRVDSGYRRARTHFEPMVVELMKIDCGDLDCSFCPWFHQEKGCILTGLSSIFSDRI